MLNELFIYYVTDLTAYDKKTAVLNKVIKSVEHWKTALRISKVISSVMRVSSHL